jgi:hypothetical protein
MKYIFIIYLVLIHLVILGLSGILYLTPKTIEITKECDTNVVKEVENNNKLPLIASLQKVKVLPHPPDFLVSREIIYRSFQTIGENGKSKVVFEEFKDGKFVKTTVDEESVKWK